MTTLRALQSAAKIGWLLFAALLGYAVFRALAPGGGSDFAVFHSSWQVVLSGHGADVYHRTTDRFLYAPGFAWLFSPLGWLPRTTALVLFCALKVAALIHIARIFQRRLDPTLPIGLFALGSLLLAARAILIDFQYGQVNTLLIWSCVYALDRHFSDPADAANWFSDPWAWLIAGAFAVVKLVTLPVLLVPWVIGSKNLRPWRERLATIVGGALAIAAPAVSVGPSGTWKLLMDWKDALLSRGLPLETHNQSVAAFLHRYFGGDPSPVIALQAKLHFGWDLLGSSGLEAVAIGWGALMALVILFWIALGNRLRADSRIGAWIAVLCGLLITPSHLVWKPYFVFGVPLGICALHRAVFSGGSPARRAARWAWIVVVALLANATSYEIVGYAWDARLESASVLMAAHLLLLAGVATQVLIPTLRASDKRASLAPPTPQAQSAS